MQGDTSKSLKYLVLSGIRIRTFNFLKSQWYNTHISIVAVKIWRYRSSSLISKEMTDWTELPSLVSSFFLNIKHPQSLWTDSATKNQEIVTTMELTVLFIISVSTRWANSCSVSIWKQKDTITPIITLNKFWQSSYWAFRITNLGQLCRVIWFLVEQQLSEILQIVNP
jgi:hypothetical protein